MVSLDERVAGCARLCDRERRLLDSIFHDNPVMLLVLDADEQPLVVNGTFRRRLGWRLEDMARLGWRFLIEEPKVPLSMEVLSKMPLWMDTMVRLRDAWGTTVCARIRVQDLGGADQHEWLVRLEDVEDAPQLGASEALAELVDALPVGLLTLDAHGAVAAANKWAIEALALPEGIVQGLQLGSYVTLPDGPPEVGQWVEAAPVGMAGPRLQARLVVPTGSPDGLGVRYVVLREEVPQNGAASALWDIIGPVLDLEVVGTFVHDLRQPLHAAGLQLEAALEENGVPAKPRSRLAAALDQLEQVVQGVNRWPHLMTPVTGAAAIGPALKTALDLLRPAAQEAATDLHVHYHCDSQIEVALDPMRLTHILRHIVGNAFEAVRSAGTAGGAVDISVAAAGTRARVTVRDNGIGFPKPWLENRPPMLTSGWPGGVHRGVGLGYCRQILKSAGGGVTWQSTGEATEVVVDLPLLSAPDPAEVGGIPAVGTPVAAAGDRVLMVDDEAVALLMAEEYLTDHGYLVSTAQDGEEALQFLRNEIFDIVVTDLCMPLLDGYSLIETMRAENMGIPVIVLTAYDAGARPAGAEVVQILTKPFRLQDLLEAVEQAVRGFKEGT